MIDERCSDYNTSKRDIPSFIEPRPPLISNPFMRPRPQKGTNLMDLLEDSELEEPELVQVYLRLKPCNNPSNLYEVKSDRCLVTSLDTATVGHGRRTQHNVSKMYSFSRIFGPEANQKELFERIVKDNLKKLPEGQSFTLLTYGASGSGKTFTLMGTVAAPGLVPRSLEYVFKVVDAAQKPIYKPADNGAEKLSYSAQENELRFVKQIRHVSAPLRDKYRRMSVQLHNDITNSNLDLSNRSKHYVWVSFVEIYNEGIYDLLSNADRSASSKLAIREDSNGHVYVKGATQIFVRTGEEAYDVMVAGKHNLQVAATGVNANSSRSHCIFTITMLTETDVGCRVSTVRLCDLAGCERVRRTRNAGARLAESRAINSSLHVLERCLRTLRNRQRAGKDALVPYRESKLTRLLGSGLSGARGEAVCVVVTLNPAPECAHETRHVLQLAAVARDIQINNTVSEYSSLETTHDSSITNAEVMKLRSENERLHFELLQAQSRNRDLQSDKDELRAANAVTLREVADEAKDMTRQYYEKLLKDQQKRMDEMKDEYEEMLSKVPLQNKVSELTREIAILEEKLSAEKLARARAEEELQHLRVCIEERDEKPYKDKDARNTDDVVSLSDSEESDSEESKDPYNESLEPTFKKEDINRSRLIRKSISNTRALTCNSSDDNISEKDSTVEKINGTLSMDKSHDTLFDDGFDEKETHHEESMSCKADDEMEEELTSASVHTEHVYDFEPSELFDENNKDVVSETVISSSDAVEEKSMAKMFTRGTYFVRRSQDNNKTDESSVDQENDTLDVIDTEESQVDSIHENEVSKDSESLVEEPPTIKKMPPSIRETLVNKIFRSLKSTSEQSSNASLVQFEQLEKAAKEIDTVTKERPSEYIQNFEKGKEKKNYYFGDASDESPRNSPDIETSIEKKIYFDNPHTTVENCNKRLSDVKNIANLKCDQFRSPSIVKEDNGSDYDPKTMKLFGETFARQPDPISIISKSHLLKKKNDSVDVFEDSPCARISAYMKNDVEKIRVSIDNIVLNDDSEITVNSNAEFNKPEKPVVNENPEVCEIPSVNENSEINKECTTKTSLDVNTSLIIKFSPVNKKPKPVVDKKSEIKEKSVVRIQPTVNIEFLPTEKPVVEEISKVDDKSCENAFDMMVDLSSLDLGGKVDSTLDEFERIYKNVTGVRATEFDLLAQEVDTSNIAQSRSSKIQEITNNKIQEIIEIKTQETTDTEIKEATDTKIKVATDTNIKEDTDTTKQETVEIKTNETTETNVQDTTEIKYNLRRKIKKSESEENDSKPEINIDKREIDENYVLEILKESEAKCESVAKSKRNLRLRRRKNQDNGSEKSAKLKDLVNLQTEFSDVTLDVPAPKKEVVDIESPEKDENLPPAEDAHSCLKSVTRSRRKLFTPRAEPLDDDFVDDEAASGERVRVLRPSYQRPRARRKL